MLALLLLSVDDPKTADTLTILYRKYSKLMYSEAYKVLKDPDDAQDAVADAEPFKIAFAFFLLALQTAGGNPHWFPCRFRFISII